MANYNLTQTGDEVQAYIDSIPVIDVTGTLSGSVVVFTTNPYPQVAANYEAGCGSIIRLTVGEDIHLIPITRFDGTAYKGSTMTGWNNVVATIEATSASAIVAISGIDDVPTAGSRNPVTSTGINTSLQNLNNSINSSLQTLQNEIDSIQPIVIEGNVTNAPDEEDITTDSNDLLKFKNRAPGLNQLGYFILRRDQTFAAQVTEANTIYEIRYEFDLNGGSVTIPSGCVLKFNGGCLKNGTLNGVLHTLDGKIDASDVGCVYNNSLSGTANVNALKILEGVTNEITLTISGSLYLASGYINILNSIHIIGNNNSVYLNGFTGFKVAKDITLENANILGNSIYESGATSVLFDVQAGITPNNINIANNSFSGNVRVLNSSNTTDAALTQYIESLIVDNNTFENIACQPSSLMFKLTDTNFRSITFSRNLIHNFFGVFLYCGITNGSEDETNIANFYAQKGRRYVIENNRAYNDINFRPWDNVAFYQAGNGYYCFFLAEKGDCLYSGNVIENIISNYTGTATYDAYLSVTNLEYSCNTIKNCLNLVGTYNELLKSKGLTGVCRYVGNTYITEDLSSAFSDLTINQRMGFHDTQGGQGKLFFVENNTFDIYQWSQVEANALSYDETIITGNYFHVQYIGDGNTSPSLLGAVKDIVFKNNIVKIDNYNASFETNKKVAPPIMVNPSSSATYRIVVKDNSITNAILYRMPYVYYNGVGFVGEISDNRFDYSLLRLKEDALLLQTLSDQMYMNDNIFKQNTSNQLVLRLVDHLLAEKMSLRVQLTTSTTLYLFRFSNAMLEGLYKAHGACFNVVFKIFNKTTGSRNITEVKFNLAESGGTYSLSSVYGYNGSYVLAQLSASSFLLNHLYGNYASNMSTYYHASNRYISIPSPQLVDNSDLIVDVEVHSNMKPNKYLYHPKSGVTAYRPAILDTSDVGFEYYDTTLKKSIYASAVNSSTGAVTWLDAAGAAV